MIALLRLSLVVAVASLGAACASTRGEAHPAPAAGPDAAWAGARQLVLVVTPDADATSGRLRAFERASVNAPWAPVGAEFPITVGRSGLAWGIGLHPPQPGLAKREGDGRAPAGVFRIGTAFGYAPQARTGLHYAPMSATQWCVDVDGSPLYNRIVDSRVVGDAAVADSSEPMRRDLHAGGDQRYRLGFVIEHNAEGRASGGSCIFAHLWKAPGEPTAGCTAMDPAAMDRLLAWLDDGQRPVLVQLTRADAVRLAADWRLPALED
jgi:L,D-peptidoglycan transpeptidase YkuD (ErfK/YbiS/YcfS/YnhG family)